MKNLRYIRLCLALLAGATAAACSGSDDDASAGTPEGAVRITADKTQITADGSDAVTFRVEYGSQVVSTSSDLTIRYTAGSEEGTLAAGQNTFSTTAAGTYTFRAVYRANDADVVSENTAVVTAVSPGSGETQDYYHKLLGMQFTSIGCQNCPALSKSLRELAEEQPGRIAVASFHLDYGGISDGMKVTVGERYQSKWSITGLPTFIFDLRSDTQLVSEKALIAEERDRLLAEYPPTCGIAIDASSYDEATRKLSIDIRLTANSAESYRVLVLLVEDGIEGMQAGSDESVYTHNNVVRSVLSDNIFGDRVNSGAAFTPGTEVSVTKSATLDANWDPSAMRVIAAALVSTDGGVSYVSDNATECPVGDRVDYVLND